MIQEHPSLKRYWYSRFEGYTSRSQRRLQVDLGVDEAATEIILRLQSKVIELQLHIRQMESELTAQDDNQHIRLVRIRKIYDEAAWIELDYQE